ncbi:MAG: type IV secretion system protein VirD4 [Pseudobutyrivibrio ruminis]|nr:type IV secretion system protein VirD4 [Pseudobutyrivibrio ruminis]
MDELAVLDGDKYLLQLRGVRPFLLDKYDATQHPFYKETGEYDYRNRLDIKKFVNHGLYAKKGKIFTVLKMLNSVRNDS